MKWIISLISLQLASLAAGDQEVLYRAGNQLLRFDGPSKIENTGSKIIAGHILNPKTNRWELVWGDKPWQKTWISQYLRFEGSGDNIHAGETLIILQPVTISMISIKGGEIRFTASRPPIFQLAREAPKPGQIEKNPKLLPAK